jgi:hypothetical protein
MSLPKIMPMFSACTVHSGEPWWFASLSLSWRIDENKMNQFVIIFVQSAVVYTGRSVLEGQVEPSGGT